MQTPSPTSPRKLNARELEREAYQLRLIGYSYQQIADALGRPRSTVHKAVQRALARRVAEIDGMADELRRLELDRLDRMLAALERRIAEGDPQAVSVARQLIETRAKLQGLNAPEQRDHTIRIIDETDEEVNAE